MAKRNEPGQSAGRILPPDVNPETLSRLSPIRRESLSEDGQSAYDAMTQPKAGGVSLAGLQGPGGIWLRIPKLGRLMGEANRYVRSEIGLEPRFVELAILCAARESDSQFEWTMHEPVAAKEGLAPQIIDIVKRRKPLAGVPETERAIIALAREAIGAKKVSARTYARALKILGEPALLNLAALIATYAMTAIMLTVFDQQLHASQTPLLRVDKRLRA